MPEWPEYMMPGLENPPPHGKPTGSRSLAPFPNFASKQDCSASPVSLCFKPEFQPEERPEPTHAVIRELYKYTPRLC